MTIIHSVFTVYHLRFSEYNSLTVSGLTTEVAFKILPWKYLRVKNMENFNFYKHINKSTIILDILVVNRFLISIFIKKKK